MSIENNQKEFKVRLDEKLKKKLVSYCNEEISLNKFINELIVENLPNIVYDFKIIREFELGIIKKLKLILNNRLE